MTKTGQRIINLITFLAVMYLIFSLITIYNRKNRVGESPQTNSVVESSDTSIDNQAQVIEDEDVYEQRQLRSDSNNDSPTPRY